MQEIKNRRLADLQKQQKIALLVLALVVFGLVGRVIYNNGYNSGKKAAEEKAKISSLNANTSTLPASGKVGKVSDGEITINLLGKEKVTAAINSQTEITVAKKKASVKDIKKDAKAVIYTRNVGGKSLATRIAVD